MSKLENLLSNSKVENSQYDFKISFFDLKGTGTFSTELVSKIIKTLTAMANKCPGDKGYILVGVADSKQDAEKYKTLYSSDYIMFQDFYITGLNPEISKYYKKRDDFLNGIKGIIKKEPIEKGVQDHILSNIRLVNYFDRDILVFEIESMKKPTSYNEKYYQRIINNVEQVSSASSLKALFARFS